MKKTKCSKIHQKAFSGNSRILFVGKCRPNGLVEFLAVAGQRDYSFGKSAETIDASTKLDDATNANEIISGALGKAVEETHYSNSTVELPGKVTTTVSASGVVIEGSRSLYDLNKAMDDGEVLFFEERDFKMNTSKLFLGFLESLNETAGGDTQTYDLSAKASSPVINRKVFYGETTDHPIISFDENQGFLDLVIGKDAENFDGTEGFVASSSISGKDLTAGVDVDLTDFDATKPGKYMVHYSVSDTNDKTTKAYREVNVYKAFKEEVEGGGAGKMSAPAPVETPKTDGKK